MICFPFLFLVCTFFALVVLCLWQESRLGLSCLIGPILTHLRLGGISRAAIFFAAGRG